MSERLLPLQPPISRLIRRLSAVSAFAIALQGGGLVSAASAASGPSPAGRPLTLRAAQRLALDHAPRVDVARSQTLVARRRVDVAAAWRNPNLNIGTISGGGGLLTGYVEVPLPNPWARAHGVDAARATVVAQRAALALAQRRAYAGVTRAWAAVWAARQRLAWLERAAQRRGRLLTAARARRRQGAGSELDVVRAARDAALAARQPQIGQARLRAAWAALRPYLGQGAAKGALIATSDPAVPVLARVMAGRGRRAPVRSHVPLSPEVLARYVAAHPLVRGAKAARASASATAAQVQAARAPQVAVQLGGTFWQRASNPEHSVTLTLVLTPGVFDGPRVRAARAVVQRSTAARTAFERRLAARIRAAHAALQTAELDERALAEVAVPASRRAAELTQTAFHRGGVDLNTAMAAERALAAVVVRWIAAAEARIVARAAWQGLTGEGL